MVFQRLPNHSVMAPQFWMMAMIPAMAAATAAITAMIGRREIFLSLIHIKMCIRDSTCIFILWIRLDQIFIVCDLVFQ